MMIPEEIDDLVRTITDYLNVGYRQFGEVDDMSIKLIDATASLVITYHVNPDSEFKEICYMWEYNREKHTGTEFQEDYLR